MADRERRQAADTKPRVQREARAGQLGDLVLTGEVEDFRSYVTLSGRIWGRAEDSRLL